MGNEQSTLNLNVTNAEIKVENGELNGHAVPTPDVTKPVASKEAAVEQKSETPPVTITNEPKPPQKEEVDSSTLNGPAHVETTPEQNAVAKDAEPPKTNIFGKMFKKKSENVKPASENSDSVDAPVTAVDLKTDVQSGPVNIKISAEPEPEPEPEGEALEPSPVEVTEEKNPPEDIKPTEKSVMNFFKTFTSPTKTSKEAKVTPDASKEQSQKETPPAPSTNLQETPKAPPPPPPVPSKMEGKAEPAVKKEEMSATKAAAAAETKAEDSPKTKTRESSFKKLFRPKVDASKSSTLEAAAKPEEPPAPKPEEKKPEKKSTFGKMFKPKAPEPKKETPAPPPVAEAAPAVKAKEEPKPAAPAPQTAPDNKSVGSTEASPNMPRKLEKRNSIQLFFKTLSQKRHSDAGVQTEPAAPEKSK
ncbi:breast carcinoma-amplified sequence 1 isoform X1 [Pseudorasbora parva]|uniref:breast carcinoma-amplified sequence 1 isoform X1 n=1 Tax=Pseudorasbora parva TaxID=51549 RepID=UPI00351DCB88